MQNTQKEFSLHLEQSIKVYRLILEDCEGSKLHNIEVLPGWFCHRLLLNCCHEVPFKYYNVFCNMRHAVRLRNQYTGFEKEQFEY